MAYQLVNDSRTITWDTPGEKTFGITAPVGFKWAGYFFTLRLNPDNDEILQRIYGLHDILEDGVNLIVRVVVSPLGQNEEGVEPVFIPQSVKLVTKASAVSI